VHLSTLQRQETFDFDRDILTLTGRRTGMKFRLGDSVRVKVTLVDVDRRELDFQFVGFTETAKARRKLATIRRTGVCNVRECSR
jgi:ribonuclease R